MESERGKWDALYSNMAYDDAFRTMESECDDVIIPYVNYAFGEHFDKRATISRLRNEQFIEHEDQAGEKRITDSHFEITQDNVKKKYHLECESKPYDKSILVRIFEYDAQIAINDAESDLSYLKVRFPNTGLLLLRGSNKAPDKAKIIIETPEENISYDVSMIKVSDFNIDTIFDNSLFLLIPFYIFNFERDLQTINSDVERIEALKNVYIDILKRLDSYQQKGVLSTQSCRVIIRLTHSVLYKLTMKHNEVQQKVGDVMGGKVLDFPEIKAYHDGKAEGREEGVIAATVESIKNIMNNLGMTSEQAMETLGIPKEDYEKFLAKL